MTWKQSRQCVPPGSARQASVPEPWAAKLGNQRGQDPGKGAVEEEPVSITSECQQQSGSVRAEVGEPPKAHQACVTVSQHKSQS